MIAMAVLLTTLKLLDMMDYEIMKEFIQTLPEHRKAAIALAWLDYNKYTIGPKMIPYSYADQWLLLDEFKENLYEIADYLTRCSQPLTQQEWDTYQSLLDTERDE